MHPKLLCLVAIVALASISCSRKQRPDKPDPGSKTGEVKGVGPGGQEKGPRAGKSGREGTVVIRSLLKEAPRSELSANGLFINLGTPDQHKYLLNSWGVPRSEESVSFVGVPRGSALRLHDWQGGVQNLVVRARAREPGVSLKVEWNDTSLEILPVKTQWALLEIPLEKPSEPGRVKLSFFAIQGKEKESPIEIDWIWLRRKGDFPPVPAKIRSLNLGEPRRSLLADPPHTFSYYLQIPKDVKLAFGYGATRETRFTVSLHRDGEEPVTIFDETHPGKTWKEAAVDLAAHAGQMVRLDLSTSTKHKEREVEAGWAEPDLVRAGEETEVVPIPREKQAKNLIYILVDAARQDAYRAFNPRAKYPTPSVSVLARGGVAMTRAYTPANWTLPSVVGLFTGRYPHSFGDMSEIFRLPEQVPVLAEHLKKQGFETAALVSNPFVSEPFGLKRGWDTYRNFYLEKDSSIMAEALYGRVVDWLEGRKDKKKRFFLYIHAMDPHDPYHLHSDTADYYEGKYTGKLRKWPQVNAEISNKHSKLHRKLDEADKRWVRALYDGEVAFHDSHLKLLLDALAEMALIGDTLIIHSSDHGEEMWDHGSLDHGHAMYEEQIKTPLIIHYEKLFKGGSKMDGLVELIDVTPTMLEVLGVPAMEGTHGVSLRHRIDGSQRQAMPYAIASGNQLTVIAGQYKLFGSQEEGKLFNLKDDPEEKKNLFATHHIARRACEVYLGEGTSVPNKRLRLTSAGTDNAIKGEKVVLDEKLRQQLEALGYME